MPCNDETQKEEMRWEAVEDADLKLKSALQKLENRLKASLVACGLGAFGSLAGN